MQLHQTIAMQGRSSPATTRDAPDQPGGVRSSAGESLDVHLARDVRAPSAARSLVGPWLAERVAGETVDQVRLLMSELVIDRLRRRSVSSADLLLVRVRLSRDAVRIEVQDPGRGAIVTRREGSRGEHGLGLEIVRGLSERWGVEPAAAGATRIWAQLRRAPLPASSTATPGTSRRVATAPLPPSQRRVAERRASVHLQHAVQRCFHEFGDR